MTNELHKTVLYHEPKAAPKQIPLFEELDDGNLVPYKKET